MWPLEYLIPSMQKREFLFLGYYGKKKNPRIASDWSSLGHMTTSGTNSGQGLKYNIAEIWIIFPSLDIGREMVGGKPNPMN